MDHPRNPRPDTPAPDAPDGLAPSAPDAASTPAAPASAAPDDAPAPSDVAAPADDADVAEPGAAASREPRRHDQTYKLLFSHPLAARSLIEDVLARDWSDELDLDTLERFPTEHVDAGLRRSLSDMAWRVWFKGGQRSVVFLVEFQSLSDPSMAIRMLQYATAAAKFLHENPGLLDAGGVMPLLAAYELYTGPGRSTAKRSVGELCKLPEVPPAVRGKIGSFPSMAYAGVDLQRLQGEGLLAQGTVAEWLGAVERDLIANMPRLQPGMAARLGDPKHQALREALAAWTDERLRVLGATPEKREHIREAILNPRERPEMAQTFQEWEAEAREKGRAEGRAGGPRGGNGGPSRGSGPTTASGGSAGYPEVRGGDGGAAGGAGGADGAGGAGSRGRRGGGQRDGGGAAGTGVQRRFEQAAELTLGSSGRCRTVVGSSSPTTATADGRGITPPNWPRRCSIRRRKTGADLAAVAAATA